MPGNEEELSNIYTELNKAKRKEKHTSADVSFC